MTTPKVSVLVPNYNHARYLATRLESILGQAYRDFELIVLDDASTDDSRAVLERFRGVPGIRFAFNERNSGSPFVQWNRGLALARGEYVWIAESDDCAAPALLATLVPLLDADPRRALAYCQSRCIDETGQPTGNDPVDWLGPLGGPRWSAGFVNDGPRECADYLLWQNTVPNASAAVFRRERFLAAGGAPTHLRLSGDWLAWARLLLVGGVAFAPAVLNDFRRHRATVRASTPLLQFQEEAWQVQRYILRHAPVTASARRELALRTYYTLTDRVAQAKAPERRREFRRCWRAAWPILGRAPVAVTRAWLGRVRAGAAVASGP